MGLLVLTCRLCRSLRSLLKQMYCWRLDRPQLCQQGSSGSLGTQRYQYVFHWSSGGAVDLQAEMAEQAGLGTEVSVESRDSTIENILCTEGCIHSCSAL